MPTAPRCWKCSSDNVAEGKMRVGRVRTSAEAVQQGAVDMNTYQTFLVCADCAYRWRPHEDRYLRQVVFRRERNEKIAALALRFARAKQTCFVYVGRVEHAEALGLLVQGSLSSAGLDPALCVVVHGQLDDAHNEATKVALCERKVLVVVGTSVWGEGTDIPPLRWVVNAKAGLPGIELEQLIGRLLRKASGKRRAGFVDFRDEHDHLFSVRSRRRLAFLRQKGFAPRELGPVPSVRGGRKYRAAK